MAQQRGPGSLPGSPQPGRGLRRTLTPSLSVQAPRRGCTDTGQNHYNGHHNDNAPSTRALTARPWATFTALSWPMSQTETEAQRGSLPPCPPPPTTLMRPRPSHLLTAGRHGAVCRGRQEQLDARKEPGYRPLSEEGGPCRQPGSQPSAGQGQAGGPGASLPGPQGEAICRSTCLSAPSSGSPRGPEHPS